MARPAAKPVVSEDWDNPPADTGPVRVRCIVHNRPFTHEKGLDHGEEATVPPDVAALMLERGQVELV